MLVPARIYCEVLGLSRHAAAVRVHRGQLRGIRGRDAQGRRILLVDVTAELAPPARAHVRNHRVRAYRDAHGRLHAVTRAEADAWAAAHGGCGCSQCLGMRRPLTAAERVLNEAEDRAMSEAEDDTEDTPPYSTQRVL